AVSCPVGYERAALVTWRGIDPRLTVETQLGSQTLACGFDLDGMGGALRIEASAPHWTVLSENEAGALVQLQVSVQMSDLDADSWQPLPGLVLMPDRAAVELASIQPTDAQGRTSVFVTAEPTLVRIALSFLVGNTSRVFTAFDGPAAQSQLPQAVSLSADAPVWSTIGEGKSSTVIQLQVRAGDPPEPLMGASLRPDPSSVVLGAIGRTDAFGVTSLFISASDQLKTIPLSFLIDGRVRAAIKLNGPAAAAAVEDAGSN
ncbi:MAG TPA: hypothetical protein VJR89_24295, partial [Polyangiales bacterium]|nr:hypothetical protein [Polyangiales bacterium]